jgi:hypothetical protein
MAAKAASAYHLPMMKPPTFRALVILIFASAAVIGIVSPGRPPVPIGALILGPIAAAALLVRYFRRRRKA